MRAVAVALMMALGACGTNSAVSLPPVTALGPVTIADVASFLAPPGRLSGDPEPVRRFDWGGYQAGDAFMQTGGTYVSTWSYPPFGPAVTANGDGGEVYAVEGPTVRASVTQDGGLPYLQGFYGAGCGGTGWVYFRNDAPTGSWASLVARLSDLPVPSACAAGNPAFTRYRLEQVSIPFLVSGVRENRTLPVVVTEHYNNVSIDKATALERDFFAQGYGRLIWEAWTTGPPAGSGLDVRCPATAWSVPPAPGWQLSDCRVSTNLVPGTAPVFGWPPAVSSWP